MERHEILEMMGELKLAGMRAAFDEVLANGVIPAALLDDPSVPPGAPFSGQRRAARGEATGQ